MLVIRIDLMEKCKEPRKGLRSGHIPGSKNIFWGNLINHKGTLVQKRKSIIYSINFILKTKKLLHLVEVVLLLVYYRYHCYMD